MTEQTINLRGESDGASASGTFPLTSEWFASELTSGELEIDKGLVANIAIESVDGEGESLITMEVSQDGGTSWRAEGKTLKLASAGARETPSMEEPVKVTAREEGTMVRFSWDQPSAVKAYISVTMELKEL